MAALPILLADAAEEGRNIITGMLIVGFVFLGVIALGTFTHWVRKSRH